MTFYNDPLFIEIRIKIVSFNDPIFKLWLLKNARKI